MPHPVRSTTSLSLPLMLVPPTLELVAAYQGQSPQCYLLCHRLCVTRPFSVICLDEEFFKYYPCGIVHISISLASTNLLEVKGPSSDVLSQSPICFTRSGKCVIHNLIENTIYLFRVLLVSNSVGVVSTNKRQICELFQIFSFPAIN